MMTTANLWRCGGCALRATESSIVSSLEDLKAELDALEEELQAVYRRLWPVREAYAQATPPAALPSRRNRTDKQALIARCPRCGGKLDADGD